MSLSTDEFVRIVKQCAMDANDARKPFSLVFGKVISAEPNLKIFVDQKLTLDEQQIILTNNVRDYTIYMSTAGEDSSGKTGNEHSTENKSYITGLPSSAPTPSSINEHQFAEHNHAYKGKKKWTVHLKLKVDEKVIMLRCDGGQKYIVLDRVEAPDE